MMPASTCLALLAVAAARQPQTVAPRRRARLAHELVRGGSTLSRWEAADQSVQLDHARQVQLEELNAKEHAEECAKVEGEAWYGAAQEDADLPAFRSFGVGDWRLPDCDDEFQPATVHVTEAPLFTAEECAEVCRLADAHAEKTGGWKAIEAGRYNVHGDWVKDIDGVKEWFDGALERKLYPALAKLFPNLAGDTSTLRVQSAYLFKYDDVTGAATDVHVDSGLLSFTIALNGKDDYDGGGTWFEATDSLVEMDAGEVTLRPGGVRHQGRPVTRGDRYIIGGFIMSTAHVEQGRRSIERGVAALGAANLDTNFAAGQTSGKEDTALALDALAHAVRVAPRCATALANLGSARRTFGDLAGACECFAAVNDLNPNDAGSWFNHAVAARALGRPDAPQLFTEAATRDPGDADAAYMVALSFAEKGDYGSEGAWLDRALTANPKHAKALVNRGVLRGEAGDLEGELEHYELAVAAEPNDAMCRNSLAACLLLRQRVAEALPHLEHVVRTKALGEVEELARAEKLLPKVRAFLEQAKAAKTGS